MVIASAEQPRSVTLESRTRDRVLRVVSEDGPITTSDLVERLGLTETAVRRHLERLHGDRLITEHESGGRPRRPGRPAKEWVLSPVGHRALTDDYDHLAAQALRFLADTAGPQAVHEFARGRLAELEERYSALLEGVGDDPAARVDVLVRALGEDGYAASMRPVGDATTAHAGLQLCQGHCPVQRIASEFPQFCDAETDAFSRLLGVHVQRLATLAQGDHVCTTFVPTRTPERPVRRDTTPTRSERSPR